MGRSMAIPTRPFGNAGRRVTCLGLGGEGVLRTNGRRSEALAVIEQALDEGIAYFDTAPAYAGSEGYYGLFWKGHETARKDIFQASKSSSRDGEGALADLDRTLSTMGLDHLDLWQIHDLRTWDDLQRIDSSGGALEAFLQAKDAGMVKFIGVTGHHDPTVLRHAVESWPIDAVLMPVNPVEAIVGGFLDQTLTAARERGIAVIGMKLLGASHYLNPKAGVTAELLIRFALSQEISLATVGCSSPAEVRTLAKVGRNFRPMPLNEQKVLLKIFRPYARRLAFYRGVI